MRPAAAALAASLVFLLAVGCGQPGTTPGESPDTSVRDVVFLTAGAETGLAEEERAALDWLRSRDAVRVRTVQLADLRRASLPDSAVVWWHYAASPELPARALDPEVVEVLGEHLRGGGHLLLSLFAAPLVVPLGLESRPPDDVRFADGAEFARWNPEDPRDDRLLAGFQSWRGHPVLRRFWGGTYVAAPLRGRSYPVARYSGDGWPAEGAVWAVAKRTIRIRRDLKVGVEYLPSAERPGGRALTLGEGIYFAGTGPFVRPHLELFLADVLGYLAGDLPPLPHGVAVPTTGATAVPVPRVSPGDGPPAAPGTQRTPEPPPDWADLPDILSATTYWHPAEDSPRFFEPVASESLRPRDDSPVLEAVAAARSGLALSAEPATDTPFDLASPRSLLLGRQSGWIQELWTYPLRLARDLRFGIAPAGEAFEWIDAGSADGEFVARPEGNTIRYVGDEVSATLHLAVPRSAPGLLALLVVEADEPMDVVAVWDVDLGAMWPRSADYFGPLEMGWDGGAGGVVWRDPMGTAAGYGGWGRDVDRVFLGYVRERDLVEGRLRSRDTEEAPAVPASTRVALQISVDPRRETVLPFAIHGGPMDAAEARTGFAALLEDPAAVWTANANYFRQFLGQTLEMASPDPTFNEAFSWAKVGLDAFRVTTPAMGTGLAAGYATSRDPRWSDPEGWQWAAANDFLRRPGYAWYFGRDSIWTALAADGYGDTGLTSEALRLLARYQDVDGKILHEMSPAWAIHYDAADSTPLFLLGLEHHLRVTGDRELLRTLWPTVRRAMRFLFRTDTDGDGLIENTDVGHGWIEGGKFYGAHTTFYLAGLWAATLEATARMATWIADEELAARCREALDGVRRTLNQDFWNDRDRFYYYGKLPDGSFMPIRTILPAVPMYFGLLDSAKARPLLELFAGGEITTDWGVRMAERSNPDYDPEGYHQGMVWPLYGGWTALAAYAYHRPLSAWIHVNENLRLYRLGNLGYLPEALHGERLRSTGVTSHQAWSQAMAILPVVEGLLGIHPDAMAGRLRLHPHLPGGWSEVAAQPVRVGSDAFGLRMERGTERTTLEIERLAGSGQVELEISLPFPREVLVNLDRDATTGVTLRGGETIVDHASEKEAMVVAALTDAAATITFRHSPYPEVVQPLPSPRPGERSVELRVVESVFRGGALRLRVQGIPGRRYRLGLTTPWPVSRVTGTPGAEVVAAGPGRAAVEFVLPGTGDNYQAAEIEVRFRR